MVVDEKFQKLVKLIEELDSFFGKGVCLSEDMEVVFVESVDSLLFYGREKAKGKRLYRFRVSDFVNVFKYLKGREIFCEVVSGKLIVRDSKGFLGEMVNLGVVENLDGYLKVFEEKVKEAKSEVILDGKVLKRLKGFEVLVGSDWYGVADNQVFAVFEKKVSEGGFVLKGLSYDILNLLYEGSVISFKVGSDVIYSNVEGIEVILGKKEEDVVENLYALVSKKYNEKKGEVFLSFLISDDLAKSKLKLDEVLETSGKLVGFEVKKGVVEVVVKDLMGNKMKDILEVKELSGEGKFVLSGVSRELLRNFIDDGVRLSVCEDMVLVDVFGFEKGIIICSKLDWK